MSKLLAGVFLGVFGGVLAYEVAKKTAPTLTKGLQDGIDTASGYVADWVSKAKEKAAPAPKRKKIPVQ
ncbi:MAG: hypothetical protein HQK87_02895 [Nitrospinae bacterium]|nr:hypothetical protein [Nitrospinota bacterium]